MRFPACGTSRSILSLLIALSLLAVLIATPAGTRSMPAEAYWPAWQAFQKNFISQDGRVIDLSTPRQHTVSEGQAYAMFFALVANDRAAFDLLLDWTGNNLAGGDLGARLPAWQWGRRDDQSWGVLDQNAASDADLWIAYTLAQAGELWQDQRYSALSARLAQRILNEESAELPGLGWTLLPGPQGFAMSATRWKLNPSYLPLPVLRWFAAHAQDRRWTQLPDSSLKIIEGASPRGYSADWIIYDSEKGFLTDSQGAEKGAGGYNAIRVYLWAGMLAESDPARSSLLKTLQPMVQLIDKRSYPPEYIDIQSGEINRPGSSGFSAAMLPLLQASGAQQALTQQLLRIAGQPIQTDAYYDQALSLFALGWQEKRYRFTDDGKLETRWSKPAGAGTAE